MNTLNAQEVTTVLERHGVHRSLERLMGHHFFPHPVTPGQWLEEPVYAWLRSADAHRAAAASVNTGG